MHPAEIPVRDGIARRTYASRWLLSGRQMGSGGQFINGYSQRISLGVIDRLSNAASNGDKVNRFTLEQPASNAKIAAQLVATRHVRENRVRRNLGNLQCVFTLQL